jgi:hypothetical protein
MREGFVLKTIHGTPCIVVATKNRVTITMRTGNRQSFSGKTAPEAELQMWNWMHQKPVIKGSERSLEIEVRSLLSTMDMPKEHVRISAGNIKRMPYQRESWMVRRSVGTEGKIYFGSYHNERAAKAASIRLCEMINAEIDRRIIVRKCLGFEDVVLFDRLYPAE